jgi:hypothetical protein
MSVLGCPPILCSMHSRMGPATNGGIIGVPKGLGGRGVAVGGIKVAVGSTGVAVGGTGVAVGGIGGPVGGAVVAVGGRGGGAAQQTISANINNVIAKANWFLFLALLVPRL